MLGHDPQELGFRPDFRAGEPSRLLLPSRIPRQMRPILCDFLSPLGNRVQMRIEDISMPGSVDVATLDLSNGSARPEQNDSNGPHADGPSGSHGHGQSDGNEHGEDGMDDMMAIVGEPSPDGLIMERLRIRYGPFGVPFPGGLLVDASLDGEAVREVRIDALEGPEVVSTERPGSPDPLAPVAWRMAIDMAHDQSVNELDCLARIELERALSHLAWLRSLSRLLGWRRMTRQAGVVLDGLNAIRHEMNAAAVDHESVETLLHGAASSISRLVASLTKGRLLDWRLAGRGVVSAGAAEEAGLGGPNARASGLRKDQRSGCPVYRRIGFEPLLEQGGDAAARTLLRAREASQSIDLARRALLRLTGETGISPGERVAVEGPRGALVAETGRTHWKLEAPGASCARRVAVESMIGESWQDALAILASFDLSPWAEGR